MDGIVCENAPIRSVHLSWCVLQFICATCSFFVVQSFIMPALPFTQTWIQLCDYFLCCCRLTTMLPNSMFSSFSVKCFIGHKVYIFCYCKLFKKGTWQFKVITLDCWIYILCLKNGISTTYTKLNRSHKTWYEPNREFCGALQPFQCSCYC